MIYLIVIVVVIVNCILLGLYNYIKFVGESQYQHQQYLKRKKEGKLIRKNF